MNPLHAVGKLLKYEIVGDGPAATAREKSGAETAGTTRPWIEWLRPQEVVLDVDVADSKRALEAAADCISRAHGLDGRPIARALLRREQVGSTALGHGVAIPHARIHAPFRGRRS
ncbi:MAG: PTS sugar transporter subunit IIA [Betaproteobacteria bacterium]